MLVRVLESLCSYILRHPWRVVFFSLLPCILCMLLLTTTRLNLSFMALVPKDEPLVARYIDIVENVGLSSQLLLLVEGEEDQIDDAVEILHKELEELDEVSYVIGAPPQKWLEENIAWISDEETFDAILDLIGNVQNSSARKILEKNRKEAQSDVEGARLMVVGLVTDPFEVDVYDIIEGKAPYDVVEAKTKAVVSSLSVQAGYTGFGAIGAQDQKQTLMAVSGLTPISLLAVLILLRMVEPRLLRLISIAFPMLTALFACLGLTGFILGSITFTEGFFGLMVFGLGVDFGLHLLVRMREEQAKNDDFAIALTQTISGAGPAIIAGAITTAGAFGIIAFAPDPTAQHLGTSGCLGLLICLFLMLTLLPAVWVIMEDRVPQGAVPEFRVWGLESVVRHSAIYPKVWLGGAFLCTVVALMGTEKYHFETDLTKVFNRDVPAVVISQRVQEYFQTNTTPWVMTTDSIEEARIIEKKVQADPMFERVAGITSLFPVDFTQRHELLQRSEEQIRKNQKVLNMLSVGPINLSVPAQQMNRFAQQLRKSSKNGPPRLEDIPRSLRKQVIGNDNRFLTFVYGTESVFDSEVIQRQRYAAERIHSSAAGMGNFIEAAMEAERPWVLPLIFSVLSFVCLVLFIDLRKLSWIVLAIVPVSVSVLITFGLLCWMDVGFSVLMFAVVPLLLGLGVDDGLHVVHRMIEEPQLPAHEATLSVSRAITMTTLTTCSSFCILLVSNHPGMESMAWTLLIGLPICFFASATLIPALAVLLKIRSAPTEIT